MSKIIQFRISKGENHYVAEGVNVPVVTQAKTLDELMDNIKEATALTLEGEDLAQFGLDAGENPSMLVNYELNTDVYA